MEESVNRTRIRIVVVDDHPMVRRGLVAMVQAEDDFELIGEAGNAADALQICRTAMPDVVLMDLKLPGMDGATATQLLREMNPGVRVLVLTSFNEPDLVQRAHSAGAVAYLLKTAGAEEIVRAIRRAYSGQMTYAPEVTNTLIQSIGHVEQAHKLTNREREILALLAQGLSNQAIAGELFLSLATVKFHVSNVLDKLGVSSRLEAVIAAQKLGLDGKSKP